MENVERRGNRRPQGRGGEGEEENAGGERERRRSSWRSVQQGGRVARSGGSKKHEPASTENQIDEDSKYQNCSFNNKRFLKIEVKKI